MLHTQPNLHPANFRDVGQALTLWLEPSPIQPGRLFRGGRIDTLSTLADIGSPGTVINLRQGADPTHLPVHLLHLPAPDRVENYETSLRPVRRWISDAIKALASPDTRWPVFLHCTSGRDRTGVIVAAILHALGIPNALILEEYLLSEGADPALMARALEGLPGLVGAHEAAALRSRLCEPRATLDEA